MQFQRIEAVCFTAQDGMGAVDQVQHVNTAFALHRQCGGCRETECVQEFPFVQSGAYNGAVFAGVDFV